MRRKEDILAFLRLLGGSFAFLENIGQILPKEDIGNCRPTADPLARQNFDVGHFEVALPGYDIMHE